jgi:hypothetical protein
MEDGMSELPKIDDVVKGVVLGLLVKITCPECIKNIDAMRPRLEKVILDGFFRCADSRAVRLTRERDEALTSITAVWEPMAEHLEKERDEARDEVNTYKSECVRLKGICERTAQERDEARRATMIVAIKVATEAGASQQVLAALRASTGEEK